MLLVYLSVRLWTAKPQGLTVEIWRIDVKSLDDKGGLGPEEQGRGGGDGQSGGVKQLGGGNGEG